MSALGVQILSRCIRARANTKQLRVAKLAFNQRIAATVRINSHASLIGVQHKCQYSTEQNKEVQVSQQTEEGEPDVLFKHIQVEVKGHDPAVLKSYEFFATEAAKLLHIDHTSEILPKIFERMTLNKSRHNYGKYDKVQYERRTHFRIINLSKLTGSTADTYLEYIQRNLPAGVAMKVTKTQLATIPDHIKRPQEAS